MHDLSSHSRFAATGSSAPAKQALNVQPQVMLRTTLRTAHGSPANRRNARELAWAWVRAKWPAVQVSPLDRERSRFSCAMPGVELAVSTNGDGSVWSMTVANSDRAGACTWMTRAMVVESGEVDTLDVQTSCIEVTRAPVVLAPPRLLGMWVERLDLQDGGVPVLGEAREVEDEEQLEDFCNHVLSPQRRLPVIALANSPHSRFYGVDPKGLAEAVRGMAHVAFLGPQVSGQVAQRFGAEFGLIPTAARIYGPGFAAGADPASHPLLRNTRRPNSAKADDPGAFRRALCRRICDMSVTSAQG